MSESETDPKVERLERIVEEQQRQLDALAEQLTEEEKMTPWPSGNRREFLKGVGAVGVGAALGGTAASQSDLPQVAYPVGANSAADTDSGSVEAKQGAFESVSTDLVNITTPTVYAYIPGQSDTLQSNKISNFADAGAAASDLISKASGSLSKNNPTAAGIHLILPAGDLSGDIIETSQDAVRITGQGMGRTVLNGEIRLETNRAEVGHLTTKNNTMQLGADGADTAAVKAHRVQITETDNNGLDIFSCFSATVSECRIVQAGAGTGSGIGLRAADVNGIELRSIEVTQSNGRGLRLNRISGSPSGKSQKAVTIHGNCIFNNNDHKGAELDGVQGAFIAGNRWEANDQGSNSVADLTLNAGNNNSKNIVIVGNHFDGASGAPKGIGTFGAQDNHLAWNTFADYSNSGDIAIDVRGTDEYIWQNYFENCDKNVSTANSTRPRLNGLGETSGAPTASNWNPGDIVRDLSNSTTYLIRHDNSKVTV